MPINRPLEALDALALKGSIDCSGNPDYPAASAGHVYRVSADGRIGGASGSTVFTGDLLICAVDGSAAGDHATVGANWSIPSSGRSDWTLPQNQATYAQLADITDIRNTGPDKQAGRVYYVTDWKRPVYADGDADGDHWVAVGAVPGQDDIIPTTP